MYKKVRRYIYERAKNARWSRRFCEADVFAEKMSKVSFGQLCFRWVGLLGYFSCGVTSVEKTSGVCYH